MKTSEASVLFREYDGQDGAASYQKDIRKWKHAYERKKEKLDGGESANVDTMKDLAEQEVKVSLLVEKLREKE